MDCKGRLIFIFNNNSLKNYRNFLISVIYACLSLLIKCVGGTILMKKKREASNLVCFLKGKKLNLEQAFNDYFCNCNLN